MWDPTQYLKFTNERSRPFFDLLAQVQCEAPKSIVDLGCGPGTLTKTLVERWPMAKVVGMDYSREMLEQAKTLSVLGRLEFVEGDIGRWSPSAPVELIVSNAAFQWVGDHERLLARLFDMLTNDGTLAAQIPCRFDGPSYAAIAATVANPQWASRLQGLGLKPESVKSIDWYVHQLHGLGFDVNAWETTYIHVLRGENPILEWMRGTALRPYLSKLDAAEAAEFERDLGGRLRQAFPERNGLTLFQFPRLFFVATKR
jgi:trans-aconitate 2-methyltransferase